MLPPSPPSPPSGPPAATYFSRWKATAPLPPLPARTVMRALSMNPFAIMLPRLSENVYSTPVCPILAEKRPTVKGGAQEKTGAACGENSCRYTEKEDRRLPVLLIPVLSRSCQGRYSSASRLSNTSRIEPLRSISGSGWGCLLICSSCHLALSMSSWRGLEPSKGPTMPRSSI